MELLGAAVANNASWCDAVCRSHGYPGIFTSRMWTSTRHRLRFYPNAITVHPEVTEPEVLAAAAPPGPLSDACRPHFPDGPFTLPARAWYACGLVPLPPRSDQRADDRQADPG